ncbi:MAG: glycosyltransferase family 39 protein [Planctomycetota bacterium]|nr:glycosyltransferase family 39 protein [Planctomycetota bacterium]
MTAGPTEPVPAPTSPDAAPPRVGVALMAIVTLAIALRLLHLWLLRGSALTDLLMGDAQAYDEWARRIASGQWLGTEVFYQSPLYPYAMALVYAAFGPQAWAVRLTQVVLGGLSCLLLAKAGESLISRRAGLIAALLLAIHPTAIFFDGLIQKSSLDLFLLCLTLCALGCTHRRPTTANVMLTGLATGALILNRENAAVLLVPIMLWLTLTCHPRTPRKAWPIARTLLALLLGVATILGPVATRNKIVGGEFHITTSQFGPNFYIGNRPGADGLYAQLKWGRADARYERQDATDLAEAETGRKLSPAEVSAHWRDKALAGIRADPGAWLRVLWRKWLLAWNAVEIADTEDQYTWAEESWLLRRLAWLHMGVVVPLAAAGLCLAWRLPGVRLVAALLLTYALGVVAFYVFARYRYPLLPMLLLLAGAAVAAPWPALLRERRFATIGAAAVTAALAAVMANRPLLSVNNMLATTHLNLGAHLAEAGRFDEAEHHLREAQRFKPRFVEAYFNLGLMQLAQRQWDQAADSFTQALRLSPGSPEASRGLRDAIIGMRQEREKKRPSTMPAATEPAR